ncbi:PLP-dependent transferase [Rubrivirga sp. S365]|uniref:PLP-dependent transferase n=1 Tax=Rubrivirga litoralis TaxID=3075598 RepID=A0ABU3BLX3_9BACT|nr:MULTISPECIES: PLP-dependent transferase [unclassified Rubrivirga]MDT0630271.1 PLP-dependent transferase [Rubrivirga sp. F394]MDT7855783.1 PLP-dependent transferase [Rubrivirga sp. S365]
MPLDPDSVAVHAGRSDLRALGVHALPIDLSTTYPFERLDDAVASLDALMGGAGPAEAGGAVYSRLWSPTVARFEAGYAEVEGAEAAVAFASGMAAITATLLAAREEGKNHVVGVRPTYGTTDRLLSSGLLGLDVTWTDAGGVAGAVRDDTALVCVETPVNPTLDLVDVAAVVEAAGAAPVCVDSTFGTPVLQHPLAQGAALVWHSATKFIGGHGDVLAGVVGCSEAWAARLRTVRILTGAVLHPDGAYLLHRGLPTLPLRVERAQATATALAARLARHAAVGRVYHPSLVDSGLVGAGRQMSGPGPMLSFEVLGPDGEADGPGAFAAAAAFLGRLRLATPAVSLGSTDTLAQHPAGLTQRAAGGAGGVASGLVRVSVGLEAEADLWDDVRQALGGAAE